MLIKMKHRFRESRDKFRKNMGSNESEQWSIPIQKYQYKKISNQLQPLPKICCAIYGIYFISPSLFGDLQIIQSAILNPWKPMRNVLDFGANHSARRPAGAPPNTLTQSRTLKKYMNLASKSKQISRYSLKRSSPLSLSLRLSA